ncbi:tetratricopeptide repeat protein [Nonomuraea thailandensis]
MLSELGDNEAALKDLDAAIELDPEYVWAFRARGEILQELDRHEEAIADFTRALHLDFGD